MYVKSPFPSDDSRMLGQHEVEWVGPEPGNDDETVEVSAHVLVSDCERIAMAYVRRNPTQTIDVLGLEYLSKLLQEHMMYMTDEELSMFDTCIRAEQHRRAKDKK